MVVERGTVPETWTAPDDPDRQGSFRTRAALFRLCAIRAPFERSRLCGCIGSYAVAREALLARIEHRRRRGETMRRRIKAIYIRQGLGLVEQHPWIPTHSRTSNER